MLKVLIITLCLVQLSCVSIPKQYDIVMPGIWRGTLVLKDSRELLATRGIDKVVTRDVYPESTKLLIPFNFEVVYISDSTFYIELINGHERIRFDSITKGHDYKTGNDTMVINLYPYATQIKCIYENSKLSGEFIVLDKVNYSIPFQAEYGKNYRFNKLPRKSIENISGSWQAIFAKDSSDQFDAVGEFQQEGNKVVGTFRTESGDFRYLEGSLDSNLLQLSCFDGSHAFLFEAELENGELRGLYYSGKHYKTTWVAKRTNSPDLVSLDLLTKIISSDPLRFNLPNTENQIITLQDSIYINKPKVLQISGTWCPNCRDETEFILDYLNKNPKTECQFISISFERKIENNKGIERIKSYKDVMKIPYEILLGGRANRDSASLLFPQIDGLKAFPTMLFLDRNNRIIKTHTGFDGPASSKFDSFKLEFENTLQFISKK
ncbi:MAG: TlpA family protein disulfide reductase [Saprospiraceae bacterium]|nr:TlpA family protein disulfide reductase [Saprospiraceae bacterium]